MIVWNSRSHPRQIMNWRAGLKSENGDGESLFRFRDLVRELPTFTVEHFALDWRSFIQV